MNTGKNDAESLNHLHCLAPLALRFLIMTTMMIMMMMVMILISVIFLMTALTDSSLSCLTMTLRLLDLFGVRLLKLFAEQ